MTTCNDITDKKLRALLLLLYDGELPSAISSQAVMAFADIIEGEHKKTARRIIRHGLYRLGIKVIYAQEL